MSTRQAQAFTKENQEDIAKFYCVKKCDPEGFLKFYINSKIGKTIIIHFIRFLSDISQFIEFYKRYQKFYLKKNC